MPRLVVTEQPMTTPDPTLPTIADVRRAAERIAGHAVRTPLLSSPFLDERVGGRVLLKCENLQRTGSFKFRGAYNALAALPRETRARGIVAVSSGNHAQGVAEAARLFGVRATIIMPSDAPATKRLRTERSGGRIVTYDRASEDRDAVAARFIAEHGGTLIHPFDNAEVIAGQGTAGLEIAEDCAAAGLTPDAVLVPASGGGLSAGIGLAVRDWSARHRHRAGRAGRLRRLPPVAGRRRDRRQRDVRQARSAMRCSSTQPGALGFAVNRANAATGVAVSDAEALAAVAFAFRELKLVVEPGGAVALAARACRPCGGPRAHLGGGAVRR